MAHYPIAEGASGFLQSQRGSFELSVKNLKVPLWRKRPIRGDPL